MKRTKIGHAMCCDHPKPIIIVNEILTKLKMSPSSHTHVRFFFWNVVYITNS